MVRWTSACYLLLGVCVTSILLVPRVTVAHSLKQKSADEDLVFEDDDDYGAASRVARAAEKVVDPLPVAVIGADDEGLPESAAKPRVKRQFGSSFFSDDEDNVDGSGVGSGDGSGRYRIELEVDGYFQPGYSDPASAEFTSMAARVQYPIDTQLNKLLGSTDARLTRIQPSGADRLKLLVDVGVVESDIDEFQIRAIFEDFDNTGRMGDLTNVKLLRFSQEEDPHAGKCGFGEVLCPSGTCAVLCNGLRECRLGEDERDCLETPVEVDVTELTTPAPIPVLTTTSRPAPSGPACSTLDEFLCDNDRLCLPLGKRCDGTEDCDDASDEADCECGIDEFKCADDGSCIQDFFKCDSTNDCLDGSDEAPSVCGGCRADQHTCTADDRCLPAWETCDGNADCSDGSDENLRECCVGGFWCDDVCRDISVSCNQVPDCRDGSDEVGCPSLPIGCNEDQFQCDDGSCLENFQRCDTVRDCPSGDDELNCLSSVCPVGDFRCDDGECIPMAYRCDNSYDCRDATDENDCECRPDQWQCFDQSCIESGQRCDRTPNCPDGSDERGCTAVSCRSDQFRCNDGGCLALNLRCNSVYDCRDGEDERNCPAPPPQPSGCSSFQFECADRTCVEEDRRCDGYDDCPDASDEAACTPQECPYGSFPCNNGQCVDLSQRCDGTNQCSDASDEIGCPQVNRTCSATEFRCDDGDCIDIQWKCDEVLDCYDGSDEDYCRCASGQFECGNQQCVSESQRCDGVSDCSDGSDEQDCDPLQPAPCDASEYRCSNGPCIPEYYRCDGRPDCSDNSDEIDCPSYAACSAEEFSCDDGQCVSQRVRCDGQPDCFDQSDEQGCHSSALVTTSAAPPPPCAPFFEFTCRRSGRCIASSGVCDQLVDCDDGSDEEDCPTDPFPVFPAPTPTAVTTPPPSSPAPYPTPTSRPYTPSSRPYSPYPTPVPTSRPYPEYPTPTPTFRPFPPFPTPTSRPYTPYPTPTTPRTLPPTGAGGFTDDGDRFNCASGQSIPADQRCDNIVDCHDGTDERDCGTLTPTDDAIVLKTYPDQQTIKQSREVVFQCRDEGRLRSAVRWSRPDANLPRGYTDERGRLTIPNIQLDDAGVYYCEAVGVPANTPGFRKTVYLNVVPYTTSYTTPPPPACSVNQATCMNGECISKDAVCDGDSDCSDASDEMRCNPLGCEPNEFQCDNKRCVLKTWRCDSDDDCGDGSDERNCGSPLPGALCNINEFKCNTREQCIPKSFHCDGEVDCADMSDEVGCTKPTFIESPPRSYSVRVTETYTLTCRAIGVPVPTVIWRLNWGHVPEKCTMTSEDGYGVLTCPDARPTDQGAYSCEAINIKGSVFVVPDTILTVSGQESICVPPQFNAAAISPRDCLTCFCFGATTDCYSTDRYVSQLPPPVSESFQIVGVNLDQVEGKYVIRDTEYPLQSRYVTTNYLGSAELKVPDRTRLGAPSDLLIYFSLPDSHRGARLLSYGGYLRYSIHFTGVGAGQAVNGPDVIIRGNGVTLMHVHDGTLVPDQDNRVDVRFWPGQWYRSVIQLGNRLQTQDPASREDIMMVLENMDLLLIRALYYDSLVVRATLSDVQLDTAVITNTDQGRAVFVEECRCPQGYTGLSCEQCAPNYRRTSSGQWLGRCVPDVQCRAGEYGDPANNIPCLPCPCPLTNYPNQFGQSCYLDTDGQVTCNCPSGYSGRRCESCSPGYRGDPTNPGDSCQPGGCDPAGSTSSVADPFSRQCNCKQFTTGPTCSECQEGSFYLHENNPYGCIQCFCMGTTRTCSSSNLYRTQIIANPGRNPQGFTLVDQDQTQTITDFPASRDGELVYDSFPNFSDVVPYYWRLPPQFLGNKVTAYGGELVYTLRHVPYPNGAISRNSAYDVEINGNSVTLRHYGSRQLSSSQSETVRVPLLESEWRRQDDNPANREHMLMALANINYILIKATYTTATSEAALERVQMDIAETRNTGGPRAGAVEVCSCPEGYKGYSCEECSAGYTRGLSGLYLGVCVPCDCNGHSDECNPETNECTNCRDNTAGFYCEECLPGYYLDPLTGRCERRDGAPDCSCDPRGSVSDQCVNGVCSCKANVMGDSCSLCAPGYFGLSASNPEGCRACWCSGVTDQCFSSSFQKMEIPMNLIGENPGFVITNRARTDVKREGFRVNIRDNQITFNEMNLLNDRDTYYWSLPQSFTGNLLASYGGNLEVTQLYESSSGNVIREADVIIRGSNGLELVWMLPAPLPQNQAHSYTVPLVETGFVLNQYPVSRAEFLQVLSSVEVILIRATPSEGMISTTLSNVVLDTAVSSQTGFGRAETVEQCRCPNEYQGLSCESCMPGFYRDSRTNRCLQCNCNGHEESCEEGPDGRPRCNCIPGYYGDYCEKSGFPEPPPEGETAGDLQQVMIDEPIIQVVAVGSTVTYYCRAVNPRQDGSLYISWSRKNGELPYGRASDDRNGRLVITQVQTADSGQYVCTVSDGFNLVRQTEATLTVEDRRAPERPSVVIEEQRETVEVTVGQYYEVRCRADGYPTPRISWSRLDNLPLPPEASVQNGLLTFYQMTPASSGAYVCSGSNEGGQAQAIITIVVEGTVPELPYQPSTITVTVTQTDVEVSQGGTVRVDCSAPAQYVVAVLRWSRINGQLPQSATDYDGELVIPNAQPEDSGLYLCRIETSDGYSGEATTRIQILRTYNVPTVRIEPDRQTVNQGSSAEVRCIASGSPQPTLSWSKVNSQFGRGVSVDGDVLRINNAEISDRGMYVCDARNSGGSARAVTVIEVERREPPSVKMYPEAQQSLQPGNTALFQCHLTGGIPMPEITWTRSDGRPMTPNTEIKPGGIITFNQVTGNEKGTYICTARNDAGEVRSTAVLDIVALPSISIQPSLNPYQVLEGSNVRLECSASGDPAPAVAWQLLRTNYPTDLAGRSLSPSTVEYEIQSVRPEDAGTYRCTARNSAGTSEEFIQVIVTPTLPGGPYPPVDRPRPPRPRPPPPPPATGSPQISRVPIGSNYEFKCLVEDRGSVDFRDVETSFRRADDRPMPRTHRIENSVLYLYDISRDDAGEYACVGTDRLSGQILFTIYAELRVVGPPRIVLEPERQVVRPGDTVSLLCKATGDQPITITWAKERARMPPSVIINGGEMMFRGITPSDAGQYICKAVNDAGIATAVAEVVVNEDPLITALQPNVRAAEGETVSLRCEVSGYDPAQVIWYRDESSVLPLNALPRGNVLTIREVNVNNQGRYKCEIIRGDYTRVSDYIDLSVDRRTGVDVRVEADPLNPRVGETVELTCLANDGPARVVAWGRSGGGDLPPNARQYGDRLQITNLRPSDGGIYTCTIMTANGAFTENYALVIQNLVSSDIVNYAPNARSVETRSAEFGSTVVMKCQAELEPPASFTWMKQDGQLPVQSTVREATLEIPSVHAEDAGTYLCTARNDVRSVDLPIMLIVTGVIPKFMGNSYLGLPTLKDSYLRYDIELSFKPESPNGLILYNSRHDEMTGDYVAFGLQDGYAVYQFDVGAGMLSLTSDAPLSIGEWHSVKLSRNRKNGRMSVDGAASLTGTTEGRHVGLELLTPLYVGGVPEGFTLNGQANFSRDFTGCVARLVVKDSIVELMRVAQEKVNIENCNTCGDSPCNNGGICQESYTETGYKCLCSAGYTGASCDETGDTCYPGLCGNGRCVNRPGGYDCFCPFGKTGIHCEHDIVITEPAFADGSYIAYQTPSAIKRFSVGLKVKPSEEMKDGLLMYCAQNEQGDGDFTSLALRNKKLEFRFNTGTGTATLVSDDELVPGTWVKIHANRTDRMGSLRIDDGDMVHGESPGAHKGLNLRIPLYVGGVDTSKVEVASEVEVTDGFSGCISQINVNEREMNIADMGSSLVDSANIGQCEGAADPFGACSQQDPCTNGGVCHDDIHESYRCVCPLGFTGRHCEQETPVEESASFSGQSWVEFGRELIMSDRNERSVTVEFTTTKPNGLLLWHGQGPSVSGKGLDFFSIAIENGFAELKYRTRDGAGSVKSRVRVDDSVRHSLRATLGDQLATLQVDNLPVETVSLPSNAPVNARGGVFIGGVPDVDLMTAGLYNVGFDGCLHGVVLGKTRVDTISESALSGVDVVACSS